MAVRSIMAIPAAGVGFFFSSWLMMLFAGILADDLGTNPIGYTTSMLTTIALWLVIAPVVGAMARSQRGMLAVRGGGRWKTVAGEARVEG